MKIQVFAEIEIPPIPEFLKMTDGNTIPLSAIGFKSLEEVGKVWTEELIKKANEQTKCRKEINDG